MSAWAQGPVRPVWLQGSRVTYAVPPRARSPASRRALTSACGPCGALVVTHARRLSGGVENDAPDDRVGAGGAESAGGEHDGSAHGVHVGCGGHRVLLPLRARTPGPVDDDRERNNTSRQSPRPSTPTAAERRSATTAACTGKVARRALPPIRTFTVGPGISPGQPAAGCGRVADYNRRFGITPTPECAAADTGPVCHAGHGLYE